MNPHLGLPILALLVRSAVLPPAFSLLAEQVQVRHSEGRIHGFLALRNLDGQLLASGTSTQLANGNVVTNELVFRFKDGSVRQETAVFSQRRTFRLLKYHLLQKGPAFKSAINMSLNASTGAGH